MSYRRKRTYKPSRYAAFSRPGRNVRRGTRVRRGDESYGGAVYRYAPQVNPKVADMKWLLWSNDHQSSIPPNQLQITNYGWGNPDGSYAFGGTVPYAQLGNCFQSKYVYLDDPWFCPLVSSGAEVWKKRVSSAILIKKIQCSFAVRPMQMQIPGILYTTSGEFSTSTYRLGKTECLVNGIFRWWLLLDTQCNGTRLNDYDVGPYTNGFGSLGPSYIFDSGFGYCSTLNDLNRGRFRVVTVRYFPVCGDVHIAFNPGQAAGSSGLGTIGAVFVFTPP